MPSVNPVMPDLPILRNDLTQFGNDLSTSAIALVNAVQLSSTNPPSVASIQSAWGQAWNVFAADWSKTYQAFVQVEDDALAAIGQELNMLLYDLGIPLLGQSSSSPPPTNFQTTYSPTAPTPAPPTSSPPLATGSDPLHVLDLNTGETVPSNVTLNTFSTWDENLLAQVSGATVSSYSWNLSQAPDLTNVSGTTTANLQGTWANFSGSARTDTISVTETPQSGSPITMTMTFAVTSTSSSAYSSTQPTSSSTWPTVITPDQLLSGQPTQSAGPYASIGEAGGSVQTSFSMPSYNPNTTPVSLDYSSTAANPRPIFLTEYQLPFGQSVPSTITAQLTFDGTALTTMTYSTSGLNPGDIVQIALQANATGLSTGRYPWSITVTNGSTPTTYSGNVDIVNQANSPYGAGWSLDNVEQLVSVSGGMMLVNPDGTSLFFASNGQGGFTTPADDFSTLVQNANGSYTQTLTDGTQINFNSGGQETSTVDTDGNTTSFSYTSGLLTSITDMNGQVTTLTYNSSGLLSSITDPASRTATLAYTGSQLTSITDVGGNVWDYGYDTSNDLTTLTDPNNHSTSFTYNFADRVSSVTQPDGSTEELTAEQMNGLAAPGTGTPSNPAAAVLFATGDTAQFTDGNGNVWLTGLDWLGFGQDVADIDPLGDASLSYINANGLTWMSADALGRRTREFFDNNGNPTKIVNPDDTYEQYSYNAFSEPTQYINELGDITTYTYNSNGDLTEETNALNESTTYAYNAAGLVTAMTDANNHTTTYSYDSLNRQIGETDPLGYTQSWVYDSAGDLTQSTDQNGNVTSYTYNALGEMTSETLPDGGGLTSTYTYTYDKVGNQISETSPITSTQTATTTDTYDAMNRLSTETDALGNVTTYVYDNNGNQIGVINPLGNETTYTYNAANWETAETIPLSGSGQSQVSATTTFGYDADGEQTSETNALGDETQYTYNNRGWLASSTDPLGNVTSYTYDAVGDQILQTQTSGSTSYNIATTYNALGEMIQEVCAPSNGTTAGSFLGNIGSDNLSGSYSGTLGGSLSGSFSGTLTGSITDASGYTGTISGTVSGTISGSLSGSGTISGSFSGSGTYTISGGISGSSTVSISGSLSGSFPGPPGSRSGSISGMIVAGISGSTSSTGIDSGSLNTQQNTSLVLSGGGSGTGDTSGSFTASQVGPTTTYSYDSVGNLLSQNGPGTCSGFG